MSDINMLDEQNNVNQTPASGEAFGVQENPSSPAINTQTQAAQVASNANAASAAPASDELAGQTTLKVNIGDPDRPEQIEIRTPNFGGQHVLHLLVLFGLMFLAFTFVFQVYLTPVYVVGRSMCPTLNLQSTGPKDEDHTDLIYTKPTTRYKNGDIVVTDTNAYPGQTDSIVKRVIATEGQTLTFKLLDNISYTPNSQTGYDYYTFKYTIWLNGELIDEPYIMSVDNNGNNVQPTMRYYRNTDYDNLAGYNAYKEFCETIRTSTNHEYSIAIKPGHVFVMGDNRGLDKSTDSRCFGQIQTKHLQGKVALHIPYGTNFFIGLWNSIFKRNNTALTVLWAN